MKRVCNRLGMSSTSILPLYYKRVTSSISGRLNGVPSRSLAIDIGLKVWDNCILLDPLRYRVCEGSQALSQRVVALIPEAVTDVLNGILGEWEFSCSKILEAEDLQQELHLESLDLGSFYSLKNVLDVFATKEAVRELVESRLSQKQNPEIGVVKSVRPLDILVATFAKLSPVILACMCFKILEATVGPIHLWSPVILAYLYLAATRCWGEANILDLIPVVECSETLKNTQMKIDLFMDSSEDLDCSLYFLVLKKIIGSSFVSGSLRGLDLGFENCNAIFNLYSKFVAKLEKSSVVSEGCRKYPRVALLNFLLILLVFKYVYLNLPSVGVALLLHAKDRYCENSQNSPTLTLSSSIDDEFSLVSEF